MRLEDVLAWSAELQALAALCSGTNAGLGT